MTLSGHYISEHLLEFGHGQKLEHPQDGLFPFMARLILPVAQKCCKVGVIGATEGIHLVKGWLAKLAAPLPGQRPEQTAYVSLARFSGSIRRPAPARSACDHHPLPFCD